MPSLNPRIEPRVRRSLIVALVLTALAWFACYGVLVALIEASRR